MPLENQINRTIIENIGKMKLSIHLLPIVIIIVGLISCFVSAIISLNYWNFFGLLIISSLSTLLIGVFFGFLFGIPKLNKSYNPTDNYEKTNKYNPNTNLEEISDWLTKIIVGISLTQLTKIPKYVGSIADYIFSKNECKLHIITNIKHLNYQIFSI